MMIKVQIYKFHIKQIYIFFSLLCDDYLNRLVSYIEGPTEINS